MAAVCGFRSVQFLRYYFANLLQKLAIFLVLLCNLIDTHLSLLLLWDPPSFFFVVHLIRRDKIAEIPCRILIDLYFM